MRFPYPLAGVPANTPFRGGYFTRIRAFALCWRGGSGHLPRGQPRIPVRRDLHRGDAHPPELGGGALRGIEAARQSALAGAHRGDARQYAWRHVLVPDRPLHRLEEAADPTGVRAALRSPGHDARVAPDRRRRAVRGRRLAQAQLALGTALPGRGTVSALLAGLARRAVV